MIVIYPRLLVHLESSMIKIFVYINHSIHLIFSPETYDIALASGGLCLPDPLIHIPTILVHPAPFQTLDPPLYYIHMLLF